jgi:hypothetical protein
MRTIIIATALLAAGLSGPANATNVKTHCAAGAEGRIVAAGEVRKGLEDLGYRVDRIKDEHGCYEVIAVNDSGFAIKAHYSNATGELIQARLR